MKKRWFLKGLVILVLAIAFAVACNAEKTDSSDQSLHNVQAASQDVCEGNVRLEGIPVDENDLMEGVISDEFYVYLVIPQGQCAETLPTMYCQRVVGGYDGGMSCTPLD